MVNAAGLVGGIKTNIENQIEFLDTNYLIQSNLIKVAYKNNIKNLLMYLVRVFIQKVMINHLMKIYIKWKI